MLHRTMSTIKRGNHIFLFIMRQTIIIKKQKYATTKKPNSIFVPIAIAPEMAIKNRWYLLFVFKNAMEDLKKRRVKIIPDGKARV